MKIQPIQKSVIFVAMFTWAFAAVARAEDENVKAEDRHAAAFIRKLQAGEKITLVTMGTSLTGGTWRWPDVMMGEWLNKEFAGKITFFNEGVGASSSSQGPGNNPALSGLGKLPKVIAHKPDVVFIEFATNDAYLPYKISLEESKKNLNAMIDAILAANPHAEIILQTMNPCTGPPSVDRPQLSEYVHGYRDVAKARKLLLIDHYVNWQKLLTESPAEFAKLVPDGVHPHAEGYRQVLLPQLKEALLGAKLHAENTIIPGDVPRGVAASPWPESLGNHRACVRVEQGGDAVWVSIPWRRRDLEPEKKDVIVVDAATKKRIDNVLAVSVTRERGELLFNPATVPGDYFVYYMPYERKGSSYFPTTAYLPPAKKADANWAQKAGPVAERLATGKTEGIPQAKVVGIEALNEFHRFDPMEVIATADELKSLVAKHANEPYLLFPEDRGFSIRMTDDLPLRWIRAGPGGEFKGEACRNEFFAFQIGLFASSQNVQGVAVEFTDLKAQTGQTIAASALRCFNTGGTDWLGKSFSKDMSVMKGKVQPFWCGVMVPRDAAPAIYTGLVTLRPKNSPAKTVRVALTVNDKILDDSGDSDPRRQSRLRWLDSTIGLDDEVFAPYTPVTLDQRNVGILGRRVTFNSLGLLDSIQSTFGRNVDTTDAPAQELLAGPMQFVAGGDVWRGDVKVTDQKPGAISWSATNAAGALELDSRAKMECDGYINFKITLRARAAADLDDIRLEIPLRRDVATYMMGLGRKGGVRPKEWKWKWNVDRSNNELWIGDVNAGLSLKLKHVDDRWDLFNLQTSGTYRDWSNAGKGGCDVVEDGDRVIIRAFTGARHVAAGEELHFNFGVLITPAKTLDKEHWNWRYYHNQYHHPNPAQIAQQGVNVINLHQGDGLNPHINYPFVTDDKLAAYASDAHSHGLKVKTYYTVRELSNYVSEFWALRSLGDEIFLNGPGFHLADQFEEKKAAQARANNGSSWLCEHAVTDYVPAWHQPLGPGHYDAAIATTGLSRWHNYYLEGLDWLIRKDGVDGLYLDGVGYDREIMKRVRKVMQRARPGCLIDFHSGNSFAPQYGLNNPANQYMELFPFIDSLWYGEGFNYNETPDYWLVEVAGIPYGLFGEMLEHGGNPWRGMVYGMTGRQGWGGDPRPMWKLWDEFGIRDAQMIGNWDHACPVTTSDGKVLATVYKKKDKTLVAIASWANEALNCRLNIDWKALGLDPSKAHLYAPALGSMQSATLFNPTEEFPVMPGRGWLFIIDEAVHDAPALKTSNAYDERKLLLEDNFNREQLGADWKTALSNRPGTALQLSEKTLAIQAPANCFAYAERALPPGSTLVECSIFSGTDQGATWGPGLAVVWKDKSLRINLRGEGRFGVDAGGGQDFGGTVLPNTWHRVRIRWENEKILAEVSRDGKLWFAIHEFSGAQFKGEPVALRLGKMKGPSEAVDFSTIGAEGTSAFKELRVFGTK